VNRFVDSAKERLVVLTARPSSTLERLWTRAALESIVAGAPTDPSVEDLKRRTEPDVAWNDVDPWPPDALSDRVRALFQTHRFAIALRDEAWLRRIDAAWKGACGALESAWRGEVPVLLGDETVTHARAEIGLALGATWTAEERTLLLGGEGVEPVLDRSVPSDRAWIALATGDLATAERSVTEYERTLDTAMRQTSSAADVERSVREVSSFYDVVLRAELRALRVLLTQRRTA